MLDLNAEYTSGTSEQIRWRVLDQPSNGTVHAVMVNHDRVHVVEVDALTLVVGDGHCRECGSSICGWHYYTTPAVFGGYEEERRLDDP